MTERRKNLRRGLRLPVSVRGYLRGGALWDEGTSTVDVCQGGVALHLGRPVVMGQVLHLTLPLPETFRRYDLTAATYRVWGLVRYTSTTGPPYRVGLMFLGRHPPRDFQQNPAGLFFLPSDPQPAWAVARAQPRYELMVTVRLRRLDDSRPGAPEEVTITEDVSLGGAKVRTTLPVAKGELVRIEEVDGPFRASALVQNAMAGPDAIMRLNLQFMDEEEAARGVRDLLRRQGIAAE